MRFLEWLKRLIKGRDLGKEVDVKISEKMTVADGKDIAALFGKGEQ